METEFIVAQWKYW